MSIETPMQPSQGDGYRVETKQPKSKAMARQELAYRHRPGHERLRPTLLLHAAGTES